METAIIDAIKNGDVKGLKSLIDQSPDRDALLATKISIPNPTNHAIGKDATFLQLASVRDWKDAGIASVLLEYGVNVDLHSAAGLGQLDRIGELLSADPAGVDGQVDTYFPIQYAITALRPDSIQCLLQHGDDANRDLKKVAYFGWEDDTVDQTYTPWKPIHMASLWGFNASRVPVAECLADGGADLNAISPLDGYRPIHLVAMPNRVDMIRFYVERGVDVESRTGDGEMIQLARVCRSDRVLVGSRRGCERGRWPRADGVAFRGEAILEWAAV